MSSISPADQTVTEAVAQAYARFEQRSSAWQRAYTRAGGQVFCGAGCYHCCDLPVQVSLAEALLTASALQGAQREAMRTRAHEVIENARASSGWDDYFQRHRQRLGYCPLLERETGRCTAYEVRPTRCRDTFSAMHPRFCQFGTLERMNRRERQDYDRAVQHNPVTDGQTHYIAPLEDLSEPIWKAASRAMRQAWGLEVWGDFWVLTTLTRDEPFMSAVRAGRARQATARAQQLGLWHPELVQLEA